MVFALLFQLRRIRLFFGLALMGSPIRSAEFVNDLLSEIITGQEDVHVHGHTALLKVPIELL